MGFVRIIPSGEPGVPDIVESVDMGELLPTAEAAADEARRLKQESREAPARMFGALESTPTGTEGNPVVSVETQERLEREQREKGSVPNIVTAHADVAKMASPSDGAYLTSSSEAYSRPAEEHEDRLEVTDSTIFPNNPTVLARPLTDLERAERSIPQPKGDEVSALAATGPYLPTGVAGAQFREGEMKEMPHDPTDSAKEMQERHRDEVLEAGEAAAKEDEAARRELQESAATGPAGDTGGSLAVGVVNDGPAATLGVSALGRSEPASSSPAARRPVAAKSTGRKAGGKAKGGSKTAGAKKG